MTRRGGALGCTGCTGCTARQYIIYTCAQPRRLLHGVVWGESSGPRIDTRMLQPQLYASRCLSHLHHQPAAAVRTNTLNPRCAHQAINPHSLHHRPHLRCPACWLVLASAGCWSMHGRPIGS
jgi:hypothetical protein